MVAVAAEEQVVGRERAGAARVVQLLPDRDVGMDRPRQLGGADRAPLLHRISPGRSRQREAGEKDEGKAAGHETILRS